MEAGQWSTVGGWLPVDQPATAELQAINAAIRGVVMRREGDPRGSVAVLDEAAGRMPPDSGPGQLVRVHLAHALRNTGDDMRAAGIYDELLDSDFDHVARYWLCDHAYLNGRFRTALAQLESWEGRDAAGEGERLCLVGHIGRVNARFVAAILLVARSGDHPARSTRALGDLERRTTRSGGDFYWVPIAATWVGRSGAYGHRWRDIEWLDGEATFRRWAEVAAT